MDKAELYELIAAYLDDKLPAERRQEVEQRMAADDAFREEVALHRALQEDYGDPARWRLREALTEIMNEPLPPESPPSAATPSANNQRWKILAMLAAVLLAGFAIWQWSRPTAPATPPSTPPPPTTEWPTPPVQEAPAQQAAPTVPTPQKQGNSQQNKPAPPKINAPIAQVDPADFLPNAEMEDMIVSNIRSEGLEVKISSPANGADFRLDKHGEALIKFAGKMEAEPDAGLVLVIYSTKAVNNPDTTLPLDLKKTADGWAFEIRKGLKLKPGLYYFTVEKEGEAAYTGKFTVGKN